MDPLSTALAALIQTPSAPEPGAVAPPVVVATAPPEPKRTPPSIPARTHVSPIPADWRPLTDRPGYQAFGRVEVDGVWRYDPATVRPIHPPAIVAPAPAPVFVPSASSTGCPGGQCNRPPRLFRW